uniref:Ig-like domain-containing protein n=1 Tax=Pelusios castaneus TaxID=367368 RepID=A0A8C8SQ18_9SAUR
FHSAWILVGSYSRLNSCILTYSTFFFSLAVSKQDLLLDQPRDVRALKGAPVTLTCSCDICNYTDFHSEWHFTSRNGAPVTSVAVKTSINSKPLDSQYKFALTHQRNSRSLLLIKNLQINDQGTYICTMIKNVPPPTVILKGLGTQLEVYGNDHFKQNTNSLGHNSLGFVLYSLWVKFTTAHPTIRRSPLTRSEYGSDALMYPNE